MEARLVKTDHSFLLFAISIGVGHSALVVHCEVLDRSAILGLIFACLEWLLILKSKEEVMDAWVDLWSVAATATALRCIPVNGANVIIGKGVEGWIIECGLVSLNCVSWCQVVIFKL